MTDVVKARRGDRLQIGAPGSEGYGQRAHEELLVLRHHSLHKGSHQAFVEASRRGVWPVYEKIGARVVGDFKVVYPEGGESADHDENYRLARYSSFAHWEATRRPVDLMGDGPLASLGAEAGALRRRYQVGSKGAWFLVGIMAPDRPLHFPVLDETYQRIADLESPGAGPQPVRFDLPLPGDQLAVLRYFRIHKGVFARFNELSETGVWPLMSSMGARVLGQWRVVYPPPPAGHMSESHEYDEVLMITRYASYAHWRATRHPAMLLGDGPDVEQFNAALAERRGLTLETDATFLAGGLYHSPPTHVPALAERYRRL